MCPKKPLSSAPTSSHPHPQIFTLQCTHFAHHLAGDPLCLPNLRPGKRTHVSKAQLSSTATRPPLPAHTSSCRTNNTFSHMDCSHSSKAGTHLKRRATTGRGATRHKGRLRLKLSPTIELENRRQYCQVEQQFCLNDFAPPTSDISRRRAFAPATDAIASSLRTAFARVCVCASSSSSSVLNLVTFALHNDEEHLRAHGFSAPASARATRIRPAQASRSTKTIPTSTRQQRPREKRSRDGSPRRRPAL